MRLRAVDIERRVADDDRPSAGEVASVVAGGAREGDGGQVASARPVAAEGPEREVRVVVAGRRDLHARGRLVVSGEESDRRALGMQRAGELRGARHAPRAFGGQRAGEFRAIGVDEGVLRGIVRRKPVPRGDLPEEEAVERARDLHALEAEAAVAVELPERREHRGDSDALRPEERSVDVEEDERPGRRVHRVSRPSAPRRRSVPRRR